MSTNPSVSGLHSTIDPALGDQLAELRRLRDEHPLWSCRLLRACRDGALDRRDFRYIFSQYQLYSTSFTRLLGALMASCESDLFRARLSRNLWEEGGGCEPDARHAELFRRFVRDSLAAPEVTDYDPAARWFVAEYLAFCTRSSPVATSAFLSLGTEAIVPRMYEVFIHGLRRAGLRDDELTFFQLHISSDDEHAASLEQLMVSYRQDPSWFATCRDSMLRALDLRLGFFEQLVDGLQHHRLDPVLRRIERAPATARLAAADVHHRGSDRAPLLYRNRIEAEGIEFTVTRIPLTADVLDPRRVVVPPGKRNERHRHAHETFLHFLAGAARVTIDGVVVDVVAGDSVLVPRWALHQTENIGAAPVAFLAVTDYHLTSRVYLGDAKAYRRDEAENRHRQEPAAERDMEA